MESDRLTIDTPPGTQIVCVEPHDIYLNVGEVFTLKRMRHSRIHEEPMVVIDNMHVIDQEWRAKRFRILRSSQPHKTNFAAWVSRSQEPFLSSVGDQS